MIDAMRPQDARPGPVPLVDEGLGNSSYLLDLGDGRALVVDPPRDLRALRAATEERGLRIGFVADTHLHADFLSGAVQLAHDDGAQVLASAAGRRGFAHRGLADGDEVDLGGLTLRALATPGHTDEHLSYLLLDGAAPVGVFSGGSLIVGSAARTDLLGAERAEELARAQYASLHRLAALPPGTALWPTHGAGSFCSAPPGSRRTSTIGAEMASNPLLGAADEGAFVRALLGSLGSYPTYFTRLGEANRRGPAVLTGAETLTPLPASAVERMRPVVVDVRPVADYAAGHVPGALSIPLRDQFATWLGWLVPAGAEVVILRNGDQDPAEILGQAHNIGYTPVGELDGGMDAWTGPVARTELVTPDRLTPDRLTPDRFGGRRLLDVRQLAEFTGGHIPGAEHVELGTLAAAIDTTAATDTTAEPEPAGPTVLMCGHGERAAGAAAVLERAGHRELAILVGGLQDWVRATGGVPETGP